MSEWPISAGLGRSTRDITDEPCAFGPDGSHTDVQVVCDECGRPTCDFCGDGHNDEEDRWRV